MSGEDQRGNSSVAGNEDRFPVGMRVLAVDDDPICLKVLDTLLRKCNYNVTSTNQAVQALKMLRENRNKYDLVISDVNMPDMDGFKLLELVGLEMDLPVIMLSAHSDKDLVYKGVTHGAVDYLLKPVRIEELKNIWQHVIRRKKLHPKDREDTVGGAQRVTSTVNPAHSCKGNRKRKDQDEDEEEVHDEDFSENDEHGSQKKPRVVWSVELHRKFVAAVNQLGLDKAVPKKILDLMTVEGLTRENVASHLQKYRLYLKRLSSVASQQVDMVAAFGGKDSSYMQMSSFDGFGDFHNVSGPGRLSNASVSSYPQGSMLGRLNTPSGLTLRGIASSGLLQSGHSQNTRNSVNTLGKIHQPALWPLSQAANVFQRLDPNQIQGKSNNHIGEFNYNLTNNLSDGRVAIGSLNNTVTSSSSYTPMIQSRGTFGTQSSLSMPSLNQESFDFSIHGSNILDHNRSNVDWHIAVQLSKFPTNSLPLGEPFSLDPSSSTSNLRENMSIASSHISNSLNDLPSSSVVTVPLESTVDIQRNAELMNNVVQNTNHNSRKQWDESFNTMSSLVSGSSTAAGSAGQSLDPRKNYDISLNNVDGSIFQHGEGERCAVEPIVRSDEDYLLEATKFQNGFVQNNYDSLDDIMNAMIKRQDLMDGEFEYDGYSLESCL